MGCDRTSVLSSQRELCDRLPNRCRCCVIFQRGRERKEGKMFVLGPGSNFAKVEKDNRRREYSIAGRSVGVEITGNKAN